MKKIFKLSSAEISKLFLKPSTYIFIVMLIATVLISSMLFNPTVNVNKTIYNGNTVGEIYENFVQDENVINHNESVAINNAKNNAEAYLNDNNKLQTFKDKINSCYGFYTQDSESIFRKTIYNLSNNTVTLQEGINVFLELKNNYVYNLLNYIVNDLDKELNFYLTNEDYDEIKTYFKNFYDFIPSTYSGYSAQDLINRYNILTSNYSFSDFVYPFYNNLNKIEINDNLKNNILTNIYNDAYTLSQNKLEEIQNIYYDSTKYSSTNEDDKNEIKEKIAEFVSLSNSYSTIINNEVILARSSNHADSYLQNCIDFENFRRYDIEEKVSINKYLVENQIYDYSIRKNFAFNQTTGTDANAFDFSFYAMQILSIIIILFVMFYISSIIAEDQNRGTIKLLAIRPITKNKIISGKYVSAIFVGIIMLIIGTICSFIAGLYMYGFSNISNIIVAFNSTNVLILNPIILYLIYFANLVVNLLFFASIATLFAVITKSGVWTSIISILTILFHLILNNTLFNNKLYAILPSANLDMFKFFGNNSVGFLNLFLLPDVSLLLSLIYVPLSIIMLNLISHAVFLKRDLA